MKFVCLLILGILFCPVALAQEYSKVEFYAGYSSVRTDDEIVDLMGLSPGLFGTASRLGANLNGWNITVNGNPTKWLGVVADFSGAYGSIEYGAPGLGKFSARSDFLLFLFGPQFSARADRVTFFVRPLVGAAKLDQKALAFGQSFSSDETAFAFGAGGGVDVKSSKLISVRTLQVDYIFTRFNSQGIDHGTMRALRISTGLVFRILD
ncbi:MAG TPA: hypothetical protein VJ810_21355 [Blastocatellia bacterium]|nr:hypothetical protein [Blastocatellia bacterium]